MSNVAVARAAYEAFAREDMAGVYAAMDDEIVWHEAQGLPHGGVYRGLAAVRAEIFEPIDASWWDGFAATPDEFVDAGDHVLVLGRYTATARATGRRLDVPFAHVWRFRDGRAVEFRQFTDTRGWTDALAEPD